MTESSLESIGYIKFHGNAVPDGIIDAATAGAALIGLDEAIRYFNQAQSPEFSKIDYSIPVKTAEGSWIAWIMAIGGAGVAAFSMGYLKKAGEKMAENDFSDIGFKDVLIKSMDAIQYLVKLIKHTKRNKDWDTNKVLWRNNNSEVGIRNDNGEILFIPYQYFRWYLEFSQDVISKLTNEINSDRELTFGVKKKDVYEEVSVKVEEKGYFVGEAEEFDEDILFPELEHGEEVHLEGKLTRGNESSNSIGLEYNGHILNCIPEKGSIRRFKSALFLKCAVDATVSRLSKQRLVAERRPTLIVKNVFPLEKDDNFDLFGE